MAKILIVEDDQELSDTIKDCLDLERHTVEQSFDGRDCLSQLKFYKFDLIILDWDLPEFTGLEICRQFRSHGGQTPVLFLTGKRDLADKEAGFDAGADDYLTKPFAMKELSARVRALLRRPPQVQACVLSFRHVELDPACSAVRRSGETVKLQPREFALLEFLMKYPGKVFSADALLDRVWKSSSDATHEAITTTVKRLRKKLDLPGTPSIITTVHGIGYKLGC